MNRLIKKTAKRLSYIFILFNKFIFLVSLFITSNIYSFNYYSLIILAISIMFLLSYVILITKLAKKYSLINKKFISLLIIEVLFMLLSNIPTIYLTFNKEYLLDDYLLTYLITIGYSLLINLISIMFYLLKVNDLSFIRKSS